MLLINNECAHSFFFVSGSELLEFLSNGNEPEKVMRLLKKVFDSLNKLDLREDPHGKRLKSAYASKTQRRARHLHR